MKPKVILFFLFLFLYIFECKGEISSGKSDVFNVVDTLSSVNLFIEQEISYIAPQSGSVFLVWKTINHPLEESVLWNENTRLNEGLMYTPMELRNDTFTIRLIILQGSVIEYYFWITKNKQGAYQDFWDLQASGSTTETDGTPVIKNAVYSTVEVKNKYLSLLSKGWILFLLLAFVFGVLKWFEKKWPIENSTSKIEKVVFIGLSLAVFHAIARSEIININPFHFFNDFRIIAKIIKGSVSDFLFVSILTVIFVIALRLLKNKKVENVIYVIFIFFALLSTLIAFINISIVVYLGKPFTYQWLYYSDFLGSNEAKSAFQENLSFLITINVILLSISMLILAEVLRILYRLVTKQKQLKYFTHALIGLGVVGLIFVPFKTKANWTKGQSENAIVVMVWSAFTANSNSSFFSAEIPEEFIFVPPAGNIKNESQYFELQNHNIKNVLFIVLESAGAAYFDAYGGAFQLSPNLNRYAGQSLIFDQMYAHAPATNRSLVSILGSMYPFLSYKSLTQEAPGYEHPTISSVLKAKGYRTSFFSSADLSFQNCREYLSYRDFDIVEDFTQIRCDEKFNMEGSNYSEGNGIDDLCLAERLKLWIDEDDSKNFFSMIWTVQGHYPYFFSGEEEDFGVSNIYFNRYLNCLKHNDKLIGKVMQLLEERGLDSTTLVVVTGDHGEAFGQHGQYGHGTALYEENLRVPLYFINSKLFHGERKSDIAGLKDLVPTALSVLNIEAPVNWTGRDLIRTSSNEAFYFAPWSDYLFGYRKENMKYIFNETRNTVEVYDLKTDSGEKINLFQSIPKEDLTNARHRVAAWVQFQDKFIKDIFNRQNKIGNRAKK
jgi:arylsulfatase A-like enzyme